MKLKYYPKTDSLYIDLSSKPSVAGRGTSAGVVLDYDEEGNIVGIDIDNASQKIDLKEITISKIPAELHAVMTRTNLFPADVQEGFSDYAERDFSIIISSPERAALEMLHLVPRKVSFEEALLILENLVSLRPEVVEGLLVSCRSIKVKRLFLYMVEKHEHPWLPQLDLSRVDLGHGKRMLVSNGRYEKKYRITVPRDHQEEVLG